MQRTPIIYILICITCVLCTGLAYSQTPKSSKSIWYKPTLEPSPTEGCSIVHLYGKTKPNTPIFVDVENIVVIRQTDPDLKFKPRPILSSVKSDQAGNFELVLELPNGLVQLPITFDKYLNTSGAPLLLTLGVSEQNVQMNVKISERPVKKKVKEFGTRYEVGVGLGFVSFSETSKANGFSERTFSDSSFLNPRITASNINLNWWFNFALELESLGQSLMQIQVDARYRLSSSNRRFWVIGGLSQQSIPLVTVDAANNMQLVKISALRYVAGVGYFHEIKKWKGFVAATYNYPFSVNLDSGALSFTSKYDFNLSSEIKYRYSKNWIYGMNIGYELNSFGYDLRNSQKGINYTNATATANTLRAILTVDYAF